MADRTIQIIIEAADNATRIIRQTAQGIDELGRSASGSARHIFSSSDAMKEFLGVTPQVQGFRDAMGALAAEVGMAAGVFVGFGVAANAAFEFGRRGAMVDQTEASFENLLNTIGAAPDLLDQLTEASGDTIDNMSMMSSVSTLLAGVQGDLAGELANATPQLMEVARAASRLNPALGDTSFMFDSIARGIKRASPMILDNLGIVIKMEEAYQNYADSINVAVDELNAEERQIAILNAVLESGNTLIEQAGDANESATDSYDRVTAAAQNFRNELASDLNPTILTVVETATLLVTWNDRIVDAYVEQEGRVRETAASYEEYIAALEEAASASGYLINADGDLVRQLIDDTGVTEIVVEANYALSESQWEVNQMIAAGIDATDGWNQAMGGSRMGVDALRDALYQEAQAAEASTEAHIANRDMLGMATSALREAGLAGLEYERVQLAISLALGETTLQEAAAQEAALTAAQVYASGAITLQEYIDRIVGIRNAWAEVPSHVTTEYETHYTSTGERVPGQNAPTGTVHPYQTGTDYVPHDMLAYIHRGEAVLNPRDAALFRAALNQQGQVNNYNINIATRATAGTYLQDIQMARAIAGR